MRFLLAQNNYIVGDFPGNTRKIIESIRKAERKDCEAVVFSELAISGYPPKDLLYHPSFLRDQQEALNRIIDASANRLLFLGCFRKNEGPGKPLYNSCAVIANRSLIGYYDKRLLPSYDVFDERRYFEPGSTSPVFHLFGKKMAVFICEDLWKESSGSLYDENPLENPELKNIDLAISLNASPFEIGKRNVRMLLARKATKKMNCPLIYVNQVGGNDSLLFDGYGFVMDPGGRFVSCAGYREDTAVIDPDNLSSAPPPDESEEEQLYQALTLGIRDYVEKSGFSRVIISLSGGVDSALVTVLAAEALGKENVFVVCMPSRFSSEGSVRDAEALAANLGISPEILPIETLHREALNLLRPYFRGLPEDFTEENLQARIRGLLLLALSNKFHRLVLNCSNKSEMAMGYATLYGDLNGALAPISDLTKTQIYRLCRKINESGTVIPEDILRKEPSAELRPGQKDSDTLPDYSLLDAIIEGYVEKHMDITDLAEKFAIPLKEIEDIVHKIHLAEYKRNQSPCGLKVTQKAFAAGRHLPIIQKWK